MRKLSPTDSLIFPIDFGPAITDSRSCSHLSTVLRLLYLSVSLLGRNHAKRKMMVYSPLSLCVPPPLLPIKGNERRLEKLHGGVC